MHPASGWWSAHSCPPPRIAINGCLSVSAAIVRPWAERSRTCRNCKHLEPPRKAGRRESIGWPSSPCRLPSSMDLTVLNLAVPAITADLKPSAAHFSGSSTSRFRWRALLPWARWATASAGRTLLMIAHSPSASFGAASVFPRRRDADRCAADLLDSAAARWRPLRCRSSPTCSRTRSRSDVSPSSLDIQLLGGRRHRPVVDGVCSTGSWRSEF